MEIHHFGHLVQNIDEGITQLQKLGFAVKTDVILHDGLYLALVEKDGVLIELASPKTNGTMQNELLAKQGAGVYHICYKTNSLNREILNLQVQGYTVMGEQTPNILFENSNTVMLYNNNLGMIELISD